MDLRIQETSEKLASCPVVLHAGNDSPDLLLAAEKLELIAQKRLGSEFPDTRRAVIRALSRGFGPTAAVTLFATEYACCGEIKEQSHEIALGVELLGVAVEVMSQVGAPPARRNSGVTDGVLTLTSDYALCIALESSQGIGNVEIQRFAQTSLSVFEGAMARADVRTAGHRMTDRYLESVEAEFGSLHALASRHGALCASRGELADDLSAYALNLGVAFRIAGEILEWSGAAKSDSMTMRDGADEWVGLPLVHMLLQDSDSEQNLTGEKIDRDAISDQLWATGAILSSVTDCRMYLARASSVLERIKAIDRKPLHNLVTFVADLLDDCRSKPA